MKKRILSLLLAVLMLVSMFPASAFAEEEPVVVENVETVVPEAQVEQPEEVPEGINEEVVWGDILEEEIITPDEELSEEENITPDEELSEEEPVLTATAVENELLLTAAEVADGTDPDVSWDTLTLKRADGSALVKDTDYTVTVDKQNKGMNFSTFTTIFGYSNIYNILTTDTVYISGGRSATVTCSSGTSIVKSKVKCATGSVANIVLKDVTCLEYLEAENGMALNVTLDGTNNVDYIRVNGFDTSAVFGGNGELIGKQIGSDINNDCGKITINSGTITLDNSASAQAAAIGSDTNHKANTITINGGTINAKASYGAAIGSGSSGEATDIVITAGNITAEAGYGSAIGSGKGGKATEIAISGGEVKATAGHGAAIGSGHEGTLAKVEISGGKIDASADPGEAIGQGTSEATVGTVAISGGEFETMPDENYIAVGAEITVGDKTYTKTESGEVEEKTETPASTAVAKIGDVEYETVAAALESVKSGETITIVKNTTETISTFGGFNVTVEALDGVNAVFNRTAAYGSWLTSDGTNTVTLKNITWNVGSANYQYFRGAKLINCTVTGQFCFDGGSSAVGTTFIQSDGDWYNVWAYGGCSFKDCTFINTVKGKFINVFTDNYNEFTVAVDGCTFINEGSSSKAALNVKEGRSGQLLKPTVNISGTNVVAGNFPTASDSDSLTVINPLVQVDDKLPDAHTEGGSETKVNVTETAKLTTLPLVTYTENKDNKAALDAAIESVKTAAAEDENTDLAKTDPVTGQKNTNLYSTPAAVPAAVAKTADGTEYATLTEALAAVTENNALVSVDESVWPVATPVYANGTFYATLKAAVDAVSSNGNANVIYCRPGADVGVMTHAHVVKDLTVYGNDAYISGGEKDFEIDTYSGIAGPAGSALTGDVTLNVYKLGGAAAWGQRNSEYVINLNFYDCQNMQRVYFSTAKGTINVNVDKCSFDGEKGSNKDTSIKTDSKGTWNITDTTFENVACALAVTNENGEATVNVTNCKFENVATEDVLTDDNRSYASPIRVLGRSETSFNADNLTFTYDEGKSANFSDIVIGEVRANKAASGTVKYEIENTAAQAKIINPHEANVVIADVSETKTVAATETLSGETEAAPSYVAKIGDQGYETLAEAIAAVGEGETIQLLAGTIEEGEITLPASLTNVTIKGAADNASILKNTQLVRRTGGANYDGLTVDGVVFDNSRIMIVSWDQNSSYKNFVFKNNTFRNLNDTTNEAAIHINVNAPGAIQKLTLIGNTFDGITGGSKSAVYGAVTGNVTVTGNTINNVAFRSLLLQIIDTDGIADNVTVTGNTFSGSSVGRLQIYGSEDETTYEPIGTDNGTFLINNNIFKGITNAQQICCWGINTDKVTADITHNYYDQENPKMFWNDFNGGNSFFINDNPEIAAELPHANNDSFGYYTELNDNGTIKTESYIEVEAPAVLTPDENGVYHVATMDDLNTFRSMVNGGDTFSGKTVVLDNNITFSGDAWTSGIGGASTFNGTFDGNGKTISGLKITGNSNYIALFGHPWDADIKNLTLDNPVISNTATDYTGAVCGGGYARVSNVTVTGGSVTGVEQVGAIIGYLSCGSVKNCTVNGTVITANTDRVGGIAGKANVDSQYVISGNTVSGVTVKGAVSAALVGQIMTGSGKTWQITDNNILNVTVQDENGAAKFNPIGNFRSGSFQSDAVTGDHIVRNHWEPATTPDSYTMVNPANAEQSVVIYNFYPVCEIVGGHGYATVAEAIADAQSGDTVKLVKSVDENVTVAEGKNIVLDLNGFTVNGGDTSVTPTITNNGTLTITDSSENGTGMIKRTETTKSPYYVIDNTGNLTIDKANVYNKMNGENASLIRSNTGKLTINDGTFKCEEYAVIKLESGDLEINGGFFDSYDQGTTLQIYGNAVINGGSFTRMISKESGGTIVINAGNFKYDYLTYVGTASFELIDKNQTFAEGYQYQVKPNEEAPEEYDAKLVTDSGAVAYYIGTTHADGANAALNAQLSTYTAYFNYAPTEVKTINYTSEKYYAGYADGVAADGHYAAASGMELVTTPDESTGIICYTVKAEDVAEIKRGEDTLRYTTIAYASTAAQEGETITVLKDYVSKQNLIGSFTGTNLTIDLNGKTLSIGGSASAAPNKDNKTLTFVDNAGTGVFDALINNYKTTVSIVIKGGTFPKAVVAKEGTITIEGGYFQSDIAEKAYSGPNLNVSGGSGELVITGGYFVNDPTAFVPEGYKVVTSDVDGYSYKVVEKTYVAQIGDQKFATLDKALVAAQGMTGDVTIKLLDSFAEVLPQRKDAADHWGYIFENVNVTITADSAVVADLTGTDYHAALIAGDDAVVTIAENVTLKNCGSVGSYHYVEEHPDAEGNGVFIINGTVTPVHAHLDGITMNIGTTGKFGWADGSSSSMFPMEENGTLNITGTLTAVPAEAPTDYQFKAMCFGTSMEGTKNIALNNTAASFTQFGFKDAETNTVNLTVNHSYLNNRDGMTVNGATALTADSKIVVTGGNASFGTITVDMDGATAASYTVVDVKGANKTGTYRTVTLTNNTGNYVAKVVDNDLVIVKPVAKIDTTYYATLADAVAAANQATSWTHIYLIADTAVDETIELNNENGVGTTLHTNGYVLTANAPVFKVTTALTYLGDGTGALTDLKADHLFVANGGTIKINDDAVFTSNSVNEFLNEHSQYLVENDGKYTVTPYQVDTARAAGFVAMTSIDNTPNYFKTVQEAADAGRKTGATLIADVTDGSIDAGNYFSLTTVDSLLDVHNYSGSITVPADTNLNIYGTGKVDLTNVVCGELCLMDNANVTVANGMVKTIDVYSGTLNITGGIFGVDPTNYVADGYKVVANDDEETKEAYPFKVVVDDSVAINVNTGVKYMTLTEALAAAVNGNEVELIKDITGEAFIVVENGVTLDLAGHSITGATLIYVTGKVKDTGATKGTVKASGYLFPESAKQAQDYYLPIGVEGGGFQFYNLAMVCGTASDGSFAFYLSHDVGETSDVYELLAKGYSTSKVKAVVTVEWTQDDMVGKQIFTYNDSFMETYAKAAGGQMFTAKFSGFDAGLKVNITASFTTYNAAESEIAVVNSRNYEKTF